MVEGEGDLDEEDRRDSADNSLAASPHISVTSDDEVGPNVSELREKLGDTIPMGRPRTKVTSHPVAPAVALFFRFHSYLFVGGEFHHDPWKNAHFRRSPKSPSSYQPVYYISKRNCSWRS